MKNILFVCTGNSCRSVMAEGFFRKMAAARLHEFSVASAGISAGDGYGPTDQTVRVMRQDGVDVTGHQSQRLTAEMVDRADALYVMENHHRDHIVRMWPKAAPKVFLLAEFLPARKTGQDLDIPDPIRMPDIFYKNVSGVIRDCVEKIVRDL